MKFSTTFHQDISFYLIRFPFCTPYNSNNYAAIFFRTLLQSKHQKRILVFANPIKTYLTRPLWSWPVAFSRNCAAHVTTLRKTLITETFKRVHCNEDAQFRTKSEAEKFRMHSLRVDLRWPTRVVTKWNATTPWIIQNERKLRDRMELMSGRKIDED